MDEDLHPQDRILIMKALARFAGDPEQIETAQHERAWELIERFGAELSIPASEAIRQNDPGHFDRQ
jgi:hypothetical protein